jgi:hypothetical protein
MMGNIVVVIFPVHNIIIVCANTKMNEELKGQQHKGLEMAYLIILVV